MATTANGTRKGDRFETDPTTGIRYRRATADDVARIIRAMPTGLSASARRKLREGAAVAPANRRASA